MIAFFRKLLYLAWSLSNLIFLVEFLVEVGSAVFIKVLLLPASGSVEFLLASAVLNARESSKAKNSECNFLTNKAFALASSWFFLKPFHIYLYFFLTIQKLKHHPHPHIMPI